MPRGRLPFPVVALFQNLRLTTKEKGVCAIPPKAKALGFPRAILMRWEALQPGDVIKWKPHYHGKVLEVIILIESRLGNRDLSESFSTQVLSGLYHFRNLYSQLLIPLNDWMGYTELPRYKFERCRGEISFIDDSDFSTVKDRMSRHVATFHAEYLKQRDWAERLCDKTKEFLMSRQPQKIKDKENGL